MKALLDNALKFHQTALSLQAQRQQLIASNIANADTPNYKAQDVDFRSALQSVQGRRQVGDGFGRLALSRSSSAHIGQQAGLAADAYTGFRQEIQSSVDGNTVNMDIERAAFAENSIHYEASVTFINGLLRGMQRAISGQ